MYIYVYIFPIKFIDSIKQRYTCVTSSDCLFMQEHCKAITIWLFRSTINQSVLAIQEHCKPTSDWPSKSTVTNWRLAIREHCKLINLLKIVILPDRE